MHHLIWILWIALGSAFLSAISFWLMSMVAKDMRRWFILGFLVTGILTFAACV
jgi:hypothetical protein